MKISELIQWFEGWVNPAWQEKWDNCGWQIEPGILTEPAGVLVCLTPTLAVMQEAIALKETGEPVNLIFAHHPLIFGGVDRLCSGEAIGEMAKLAFTHRIGIYSAHTNFDQVNHGTADVLAQLLKLKQVKAIVPTQTGLGYGRIGQLEPALPLSDLLTLIQEKLQPPELIFFPAKPQQRIRRLAVLGGSGASYIDAVVQAGAEAYLTSDCKFHQFQEARDRGLVLIDAGHYATERPACDRLVEKLRKAGADWVKLSNQDEDFRQFFRG
ncbi:Nif3-like dinuclear metal center hexameric protein [Laspinema olomoucense]|uniref:Nif3-like dinuclear metal center hexameric protein n=1 Tax=Laspinema olomoucense TaxID=3231600 RepID=UPI0021BB2F67|nr:Nif3-like dinuclear metal center hexameric protein [Laspinema sp. D3d]MCT7973486.1 Nif3-like dinuclear metal center hexameric protein [Laspinema sp. D3d]